jgi:hypothetical protein
MFEKLHPSLMFIIPVSMIAAVAGPALAVVAPDEPTPLSELAFRHPDLDIAASYRAVGELKAARADQARSELTALGVDSASAYVDLRSGRWESLLPAEPLLPGSGVGNDLRWQDLGLKAPAGDKAVELAAWNALMAYVETFHRELGLDLAEIPEAGRVAVHGGGEVIQIYVPRVVAGVPVRDSYLTAVINHGNLVLFGAHNWGDVDVATWPSLTPEDAAGAVSSYFAPHTAGAWGESELVLVPMANGNDLAQVSPGAGYAYRLAWVVRPRFAGDLGSWEALVDAHGGEVLSFEDTNHYAEVRGGVYPVSNDGTSPDGVEQGGWPMPFDRVTHSGGTATTDAGGNIPASVSGTRTSTLSGQYVRMNDSCGSISLSSSGDLDFGTSGGTNCTTPGFGGSGNTHASRSGFYELNRIKEMARGQLPSNSWLQNQITANMNINLTCNAFWNGSTVNFYRSGGGCANTGEIAAVFDHEWGHGLDDNDVNGTIASPSGEGIADIYSTLRLNDSCIGRNFRPGIQCSGYGDPCTNCTGVRDIDYLKRQSGQPHTYTWSNSNCGGAVHCVGSVYAEAVWSLWKRKLQSSPFNMSDDTAHEVVTRLTYIGAGVTGTWFSGGPPNGGCSSTSGYRNYLAADDDNGNLNDGTPHMTAIWGAFNDQQIACATPTVQNSGCSGTPTSAPTVSTTALDKSAGLSWSTVSGASSYEVFRTDGVFACNFGKTKIASTSGTSVTDTGLQNGRAYSYIVVPKGSAAACFGPASSCATVTPASGPGCSVNADCDDGLFCNGAETCNSGTCQAGSDPCSVGETCNESTDTCEAGSGAAIWMSFIANTSVPGVGTVADEDIVAYDESAGTWSLVFDGSDVGLSALEIDGLAVLPGGDLLLSFTAAATISGISVDDSDIVRFHPTSLGSTTAGTFSLYFDGSDVGLTSSGEDVDAIALAPDGRLIVSTTSNFSGTGASGADEDLFIFTGTLGSTTSGSFALYFDGSDVALTSSSEDLDGASLTAAGQLLFSTLGSFSVSGLSGNDEDVGQFAGTFGSSTSGTFSMRLDLSTLGISTSANVGSLEIVE